MRAVLVGLVGVLLASAAQAGECRPDAPLVASSRAQWQSDLKRPDLIGKTFWVEKISSGHNSVAVLLAVGAERFVVIETIRGALDQTESFDAAQADWKQIPWGKRDLRMEGRADFVGGFVLDNGPLALIALAPKC